MKPRTLLSRCLLVLTAGAIAWTGAAALTVAVSGTAAAASSAGGAISASEVLSRAQHWVDRGHTYLNSSDKSTWRTGPTGSEVYRRDCSGLLSMVWHLPNGYYDTSVFESWIGDRLTRLPSFDALEPGDAILRVNHKGLSNHVELFAGWKNPANHGEGAYFYSFNSTGETVRNPYANSNFGNLGFRSYRAVTDDYEHAVRYNKVTRDGSYLREPSGAISLVVGGMPFHLAPDEYAALGSPAYADVPSGTFSSMPASIRNGTLVRLPSNGATFIVVGGAKYWLNPSEYAALGSPAFVNVPVRLTDGLGTAPANGSFLRDVASGAIHLLAGGARYHLDPSEYAKLGSPSFTNVPAGMIGQFGTIPANNTYLRNIDDGAIYRIIGGEKFYLTADQYRQLGHPAFTNVPVGWLNRIPAGCGVGNC